VRSRILRWARNSRRILYVLQEMQLRLANICESAQQAYRRGGPDELLSAEHLFEQVIGIRPYLLDRSGHDLATGEDRSMLLSNATDGASLPLLPPREGVVVERTAGSTCVVALRFPPPGRQAHGAPADLLTSPSLWFLPFLAVVCCTVAAYVTLRMRRIESTIAHFGSGRLGVRMPPDTGDPFGRLSRTFNQMADRIESLLDAHKRFCADISHELRSPLARLRLSTRLARLGKPDALDRIELESSQLNNLVEELLDVARAEVDPASFGAEPVELRWLLTEIADRCEIEAREKGCRLDLSFAMPGIVAGDAELLRRAIENVLRNAIRHSPAGALVQLSAGGDEDHAVISVRDHGPGVPAAALEAMFRPFYRVEEDRDRGTGGVGLGLAIAQRAIALHRGSVMAENATPGLRVEIRLPRK
jgi:signal transduction histidine kinase